MKTNIMTAIIAACAFLMPSCGSTNATTALPAGVKPYSKTTCIVTDNRLGSMGRPVSEIYQGQEIKFCCKPCIAKFHADPNKYMAKIR